VVNLYWRLLWLWWRSRRWPRLSLWDTSVVPFRVWPSDLDLVGHMNNGKYLSILDLGRSDLLRRSGLAAKLKTKEWFPVVASQTVTYRKSLLPGQRFTVATRVLGFAGQWAYTEQTFAVGDEVYACAVVRNRFLKKGGGRVDPADLEALVGGYPPELNLPEWVLRWTQDSLINAWGQMDRAVEGPE
jgi:acyl-CoA thioesterase FadM